MSILIPEIERSGARLFNCVPREWLTDLRLSVTARLALALMSGHQAGFGLNPRRLQRELGICQDTWDGVARELRAHEYLTAAETVRGPRGRIIGSVNRLLDVHLDPEATVTRIHRDPGSPGPGDVPPLNETTTTNNTKLLTFNEENPPVASRPVAQRPPQAPEVIVPTVEKPEENPTSEAQTPPVPRPKKPRKRSRRYFKAHWDLAQDVALTRTPDGVPDQGYIIGITAVIEHGRKVYGLDPAECAQLLTTLPEASKLELDFHLTTPERAVVEHSEPVVDLAAAGAARRAAAGVQEGPIAAAMAAYEALTGGRSSARNWEIAFEDLGWEPTDEQVTAAVETARARSGLITLEEVASILADMRAPALAG